MYKDLFKISINFIAIKLFIDCISIAPEKIHDSFIKGDWMNNVILYLLLNFIITFLLLRFNNYWVDRVFSQKENYLISKDSLSIIKVSIIICAYYIIFTSGSSLISNIFFIDRISFSMIIGKLSSIIVSFLLLQFSDIIAKKIKSLINE